MNATFLMIRSFVCCLGVCAATVSAAQYSPVPHRELLPGEIPVSGPGNYAEPGRTYVLTRDVVAERSAIFLGKDVTLDLNGYTIRYADAGYGHIANRGFEEGLKGWDVAAAPGAKIENTADVHVFVGEKLLRLNAGDEIRSGYVHLPVANRSYIAMCGVTGWHFHDPQMKGDVRNEMKVSVFVEDEQGREVTCTTTYRDTAMVSAPVEKRSPRLGGGFVFAHLQGLPAGKYRVRVRADTDCLVDEIDIRPTQDVGVGIVGETWARGHYDHLYQSQFAAFFDYTADPASGRPLAGIPVAMGRGVVNIRNGRIESGSEGAISWGIQSSAEDVRLVLSNVSITTSGINAIAVDVTNATITSCRFDVTNPLLINRHGSNFYGVDLRGKQASQVSFSEFFGGQGCLVFKGKHSDIHHNKFYNRQAVTNHYSIMAMGDSSRIFDNYIEPERGSGIEIYTKKYIDIFNNTIKIRTSPPTCEYGKEEYSANAIRIADYRAKPGAPNGAYGNRVFNNRIHITAVNFPHPKEYIPLSWAFFYSASGG
ncbi:right-handed parallel beta-helix repeat-containing protein [Chitinophaga pollutisoli]|uniref:Right-handed parallel beta-helix repeat-containing protein n=1 Tax=Chitinophaga pollutisoli TaxID=3133966 RepID=A0ABZ2YK06_9BACT